MFFKISEKKTIFIKRSSSYIAKKKNYRFPVELVFKIKNENFKTIKLF